MRKGAYEIKIVRNFSAEEKRKIIGRVEKETDNISNQAKRLGIYPSTIWMWIQNYHTFGMDGLRPGPNTKYSEDVKAAAVSEYLSGAGSLREISQKYRIRSFQLLSKFLYTV